MPPLKPIELPAEAVNELTAQLNLPAETEATEGQGTIDIAPEQDPAFDTSLEATQEPPEEKPEAEEAAGEAATEPAPPATTLTGDDYQTWLAYRAIDQRLQTDPTFAERFRQAFSPTPPAPSGPAPSTEAPAAPYYWQPPEDDRYATLEQRYQALEQTVRAHQNVLAERVRVENAAIENRVLDEFKTRHNLEQVDVDQVRQDANAYAQLLPSFEQQGLDLHTALTRILEAAYWNNEKFQKHELERQVAQKADDDRRKRKASSLAGNAGSAPRTPTRALTEVEHREAMIREVAEAMGQGGE